MRSSMYRRNARANSLRVFVRQDVPDTVEDPDSDSDSEDEPDTPSPTEDAFPSSPAETETPTQQVGAPTTDASQSTTDASQQTAGSPSQSITPASDVNVPATQSSSSSLDITAGALPQGGEASQAQTAPSDSPQPTMNKAGAIALGTIGGTIIIAAILFILWKCRRRGSRGNRNSTSRFSPFSGFKRMEEPREKYTTNRGSVGKTGSKIMDDLMAAAYAAEDGNASQYGAYMDEKRRSNNSYAPSQRRSNPAQATAGPNRGSNSLYVNQIMSGFYKGRRVDGLTTPANARMPPPAAPSVAGQTEVTATTESTWRTWGYSQKKPPKESWVDKCIRLGGLR
ncbi:hypothetical protein F5Y11DRAFT_51534 [Daldinia sp. FL1419]|nr:hypothetical protein F5Y11DRAFT_51534 [Daldinia sp. FL1419]